jgi:paraquat-inducible protein A
MRAHADRSEAMNLALHRLLWRLGWADAPTARGERVATYPALVVCEECDTVHRRADLAEGEQARCSRCGALLGRGHRLEPASLLALALASAIVFAIGNLSDIVTLEFGGQQVEASLPEAIAATWSSGQQAVAVLAAATAFGFPLAVVVLRLWVLVPLVLGRRTSSFLPLMRALRWVTRWSMVEVFLLGVLVAVVRSAGMATVVPGAGIFAYTALMLLLAAQQASGLHGLWRHGESLGRR